MALLWIENPRATRQAAPAQGIDPYSININYSVIYGLSTLFFPDSPYPGTGIYLVQITKPGSAGSGTGYNLGPFDTEAEAIAAAENDWDTYGPNRPPQ
jgi:hypothetical protein